MTLLQTLQTWRLYEGEQDWNMRCIYVSEGVKHTATANMDLRKTHNRQHERSGGEIVKQKKEQYGLCCEVEPTCDVIDDSSGCHSKCPCGTCH